LAIHREGRFQEAQAIYEEVLRHHPNYFDALYLLGTLHAQCGHAELAISIFEQALSINRSHAGTYNNLGNACLRLHRYEEALQHYLVVPAKPRQPA
jgi:tetratricopeptide (TPR) repeat protein